MLKGAGRRLMDPDLDGCPPANAPSTPKEEPEPLHSTSKVKKGKDALRKPLKDDKKAPRPSRLTRSKAAAASIQEEEEEDADPLQCPMMEVAAGNGSTQLVFRPWTEADVEDALTHMTDPITNVKWTTDLLRSVIDVRPTMSELVHVLRKQTQTQYHKISGFFTNERKRTRQRKRIQTIRSKRVP